MLDAHQPEERVVVAGDVAGGPDALDGRPAELVDEDPVVDLHPGPGDDLDGRLDPDADDREVALDALARGRHDALDRPAPSKASTPSP